MNPQDSTRVSLFISITLTIWDFLSQNTHKQLGVFLAHDLPQRLYKLNVFIFGAVLTYKDA